MQKWPIVILVCAASVISSGCDDIEPPSMNAMPARPSKAPKPAAVASASSAQPSCAARVDLALLQVQAPIAPIELASSRSKGKPLVNLYTAKKPFKGQGVALHKLETANFLWVGDAATGKSVKAIAAKGNPANPTRVVYAGATDANAKPLSDWANARKQLIEGKKGKERWAAIKQSLTIAAGTCPSMSTAVDKLDENWSTFAENRDAVVAAAKACACKPDPSELITMLKIGYGGGNYDFIDGAALGSEPCLTALSKTEKKSGELIEFIADGCK